MKSKLLLIVFWFIVLICGSLYSWYNKAQEKKAATTLTLQDEKMVEKMTNNKKTYCIGNYSIDIPEDMMLDDKVNPVIKFDDMNITTQHLYRPSFEQRIRLREEELRKIKPVDPKDGSYLKAIYPLNNDEGGVVFERMESIGIPDSARVLETHLYKDNIAFIIEEEARNGEGTRYDKYRREYPDLYSNNVPGKLMRLNELIKNIKGYDSHKPLTNAEVCIPNASISMTGLKGVKQNITLTLKSGKYPQLSLILETRNHSPDDKSLLSYRSYAEPIIKQSGGVIKKGEEVINGLTVQQWLAKDYRQNGKESFDFYLLVNGEQASENKPTLFLNLMWKQVVGSEKLTDAQVLAIWTEIITTIQSRNSYSR